MGNCDTIVGDWLAENYQLNSESVVKIDLWYDLLGDMLLNHLNSLQLQRTLFYYIATSMIWNNEIHMFKIKYYKVRLNIFIHGIIKYFLCNLWAKLQINTCMINHSP